MEDQTHSYPDPDADTNEEPTEGEQQSVPSMEHQQNTQHTGTTNNPLLQGLQRIPGETFRIPSLGMFYTNGEIDPSVQDGEVHVYPMKTIDEILIKTPDKLFSGQAIEEVFQRCIPQIYRPLELLSADVDYLLVCLRKVSYGSEVSVPWQHDCENAQQHDYSIDINQFIQNAKTVDPTTAKQKYSLTLDNGQHVTLSPPIFNDVLELYQTMQQTNDDDVNEVEERVVKTLYGMIDQVDGVTEERFIKEWLHNLPTNYMREISLKTEEISDWGPKFEADVQCKDCGETVTIATPLNPIAFFT